MLFVVGDSLDLGGGDLRLVDHLRTGMNLEVIVTSDDSLPDVADTDLIIVSQSSSSHVIGPRFQDEAIPVLVMHDNLWDDMLLSGESGDTAPLTDITVLDASSPVSGGWPRGTHTAFDSGQSLRYVTGLAAGGLPVAAAGDAEDQVIVFTFEQGAQLTIGTAPARRVGFGARVGAYEEFVGPAWDIFDASVIWLLGAEPWFHSNALLLVGEEQSILNASEWAVRSRLRALGYEVTVLVDSQVGTVVPERFDLIVMSKTVQSDVVGAALKPMAAGVLFWEDNQQMLSMMATIDNSGEAGTTWHATGTHFFFDAADSADELRAGHEGPLQVLMIAGEITYAPAGELGPGAIPIARYGSDGSDGRYAMYAYPAGATLADGTDAAGRRIYFGLYDDTYRHLTRDGVALFDAAVAWLSPGSE